MRRKTNQCDEDPQRTWLIESAGKDIKAVTVTLFHMPKRQRKA